LSSRSKPRFPRLPLLTRANSILLGLLLCLVKVASAQVPVLTISCLPTAGPAQVSVPYAAICTAAGGTAPYTWAIVAGSLPAGLTLSDTTGTTVTVSGTPTTAGAYSYSVQVTDSTAPPQTAQQAYSGTIGPAPPPIPTITSLSPNAATASGPGFTLTVDGTNFTPASTVQWNASPLSTTFVNANELTAGVPASLITTSGTAQITVSTLGLASNALTFTILPAPTITSLSPTSIAASDSAFTLTVNGGGFASGATVQWNGSALATTVVSASQVTAAVPANLIVFAGVAQISVVSGGVTSNIVNFPVNPNIDSLSPSSATAGGDAFTLTVNGAGFASGSVVQWNGSALATNVISSTQLQAPVLANLIANAGTAQITVLSNTRTSNTVNFTIAAGPSISSVTPASAVAGGPAFTLTVNGSGFRSGAAVEWNGNQLATTFVSATRVTARVPANLIASTGTAQITVLSGGVTSSAVTFTINPAPVISAISPNTATAGSPGFTLTVNGTGFSSGSVVNWNTTALTTRFVNATQLTATVPGSLIATAGTAQITVVSGNVTSNAVGFTVAPAPAISSLSPSAATAGGPAFTLTVNGSGFASGAVVRWNQTALATSFVSANRLTAPVLASLIASVGTAQITVSSGGVTSNAVTFNIVAGPAIGGLSPSTAAAGGPAFTLTVTGTAFASGAVVHWNTTQLPTVFVSANQVTASVPASLIANVGTAQITVVSGGATSNALTFAVVAAPIISGLSPSSVAAGGPDFILTVNGSGFGSNATVQWNGTPLTTTFVNAAQLTATVPAALIASFGSAQIIVLSSGVASNSVAIGITASAITLTGVHSTTVPTQQLNVGIQLASPPPTALQGTLHLTFTPSVAGLPAGYMDPALQFAAGGTTLNFTVPAGVATVSPLTGGTIQQGTVAGTLTVTLTSLTSNGVSVLPPTPVTAAATILPLPPVITANSVHITNLTASGFDVVLTGYSTTRDMTSATFTFTANAGTQFAGSATFTVPLTAAYTAWYQSAQSQSFGSMFQLQVPFTLSGSTNVLQSVSVTLTNSIGTSAAVSGGP
jgi:Putative Ig domain